MLRESLMALAMLVPALAMAALVPTAAMAAGRPVAETCVNAGYRAGTAAFDMCVARVSGDDPLAALEGGEVSVRGDKTGHKAVEPDPLAAVTPARTPVPGVALPTAREDLPASFNTPMALGQAAAPVSPPPSPPPNSSPPPAQNSWWPTAPTPPSITAPTAPSWNFGTQ